MHYIENEYLKVAVADHGAELSSIFDKKRNKEMLWQADPAFWNRHAPLLFPFVGSVNKGVYKYNGKTYPMGNHGFARDMDFEFAGQTENSISHILRDNEKTRENYPFAFELKITHILDKNQVKVQWEVTNPSDSETLYYSIGGHPAFTCPLNEDEKRTDYKVKFYKENLKYSLIIEDTREVDFENPYDLETKDGLLDITDDRFEKDALIFDDYQIEKISLCDKAGKPYVTLTCKGFESFGLWSHPSTDARYVCLEPWIGRCDNKGFEGELSEKFGEQSLAPKASKTTEYQITIEE